MNLIYEMKNDNNLKIYEKTIFDSFMITSDNPIFNQMVKENYLEEKLQNILNIYDSSFEMNENQIKKLYEISSKTYHFIKKREWERKSRLLNESVKISYLLSRENIELIDESIEWRKKWLNSQIKYFGEQTKILYNAARDLKIFYDEKKDENLLQYTTSLLEKTIKIDEKKLNSNDSLSNHLENERNYVKHLRLLINCKKEENTINSIRYSYKTLLNASKNITLQEHLSLSLKKSAAFFLNSLGEKTNNDENIEDAKKILEETIKKINPFY